MGKEVNKRVNVFINGEEVENNIKSIRAAMAQLTNQLNKMTIGSDEYNKTSEDLKKLKKIYDDHVKSLKSTREEVEKLSNVNKDSAIVYGAIGSAISGASVVLQKFVSATQEYVEAFATIDDAMSGVMKTTGMTREEVEALNENLKNIDTRTSQEELLTIAQIGGRMGLAKDQILDFTKAVDLANVALGDSFSGGAEEISSVLGKISLAFKETRDANIGDSLTRIGSAINEVGGKANATEPNIAAFVQRVGSMPEAFRPSVQEAVALGAAFEESTIDAEVASRAFGILMNKASTDVEGFAQVMGKPVEAVRELINSNPTQFFTEFAKSLQGMNATQMGETLNGLKLNADGVKRIVGAMSGSYDRFNELLQVSNSAFSENTSLMNEFNNVNNNSAAQLEKAKNAVQEAKAALGEELIPVITGVVNLSSSGLSLLVDIVKWSIQHKGVVSGLAVAYATLFVAKNKNLIATKAENIQTKISNAIKQMSINAAVKKKVALTAERAATESKRLEEMKARLETLKGVAADNQMRAVLKQETIAKTANAAATRAQAQAQSLLSSVMKTTPWGLIAAGITVATVAITKFVEKQTKTKKETEELNNTINKEKSHVDYLIETLKKAEEGSDEYKEALERLNELYPDIIQKHINEKGKLTDLVQLNKDLANAIEDRIKKEMKAQAMEDASTEKMNNMGKSIEKIYDKLNKNKRLSDDAKDTAMSIVRELSDKLGSNKENNEKLIDEAMHKLTDLGAYNDGTAINRQFYKMNKAAVEYGKSIKEIDGIYGETEQHLSRIQEIDKQILDLQHKMRASENKDDFTKQIEKLKRERDELKKKGKKEENSETNTNTGNGSNSSKGNPIADFEKKLKDFRQRQQAASLEGWDKTKQGIIDSYQEMIDEANNLNKTDIAQQLATERDNAIVAAGEKYIKSASDALDKIMKEADEMLDSSSKDDEENKILTAIAGTQKQWDEKIKLVRDNYNAIKQILDDDDKLKADDPNKLTSEQRTVFENGLKEASDAEIKLTTEKMQAVTNVIKANVSDEKQFIEDKETELSRSRMNDYDRQIDEINALYDAKIEAKRKEIKTLQQLQQQDGADTEGIQQQIDAIEKLIAKLENLKGNETSNFKKNYYNNVWDNLLNIDWKSFKDNWRDNLQTMTAALQEFANAAFDIFNSINQIQANREQAELNQFLATQDEKSKALQRQLDDGIISQKYYDAQMDKMQKEKEAKEKKIQHDQFERERKANLAKVLIEGGLAVATAFAQYGWPWGLIPAALSTAMTAAQTAMIASQVNPYAKGGYIKKEQIALMGEDGQEWVASNKLLTDRKTAPLIAALEDYQRGNSRALEALSLAQPDWNGLSQSAKNISTTFAGSNAPVVNNYNSSTDNSEVLKELKQMNAYLKDPKNRQAYISRKMQLEFDRQENELKAMARL